MKKTEDQTCVGAVLVRERDDRDEAPRRLSCSADATEDTRRLAEEQRLGYAATVCSGGTPNLSPEGATAVWDDDWLDFADIHSPNTVENLRRSPAIETNASFQSGLAVGDTPPPPAGGCCSTRLSSRGPKTICPGRRRPQRSYLRQPGGTPVPTAASSRIAR